MIVTVLICTRNQASSLERTLLSLVDQEVAPDVSWRVIVVNNGSCDDTLVSLEAFQETLQLRVIDEATPGLSRARNTGIANLDQGYVLFTDDDVTVPQDWINRYAKAFKKYPDSSFFGSDIVPHLPGADPAWAKAALTAAASCFAYFRVGSNDREIDSNTPGRFYPYGANMAFRVDALQHFRFDESLGRQPDGLLLSGEETKLIREMLVAGHTGHLLAGNPVRHWIAPARQSADYVHRYYFGQGWLQASTALNSTNTTRAIDRFGSLILAGLFRHSRTVAGWIPSKVLKIWIERQHGHFGGRTAAFRKT